MRHAMGLSVSENGQAIGRMVEKVRKARSDALMLDFSRVIAAHFGKMVEYYSEREGDPVSAHNNKTLFVEAIDVWCRASFARSAGSAARTENPRDVIASAMTPWYEAMELDDPSRYVPRRVELPAYRGSPEDATACMLGLCACLEIAPLRIRLGLEGDRPVRAWGKIHADGKWYDSDVMNPAFRLGDHEEFPEYDETEVPL
jgi:hypothetical protein